MSDFDVPTEDTNQEDVLPGYFRADIIPEDLPMLFPLLQAKESVDAFSALFSGSQASVLVRLMILREIGSRGDDPHWSPREIESMFSYVDETKLKSALLRLRNSGILIWLTDISRYQLSPLGRMALSALSNMMKFGQEEGSELGYITSQIVASQAMGVVNQETLEHLLSRLSELDDEFNRAIVSGSESRIKTAEKKLDSVWNWVEKGTEVMKIVTDNLDLDRGAHRLAQQIGRRQSKLLSMASRFQSELNLIEKNKVHIERGLSSSDILHWLLGQPLKALAAVLDGAMIHTPSPGFVLSDIAVDIAEEMLIHRDISEIDESIPPLPDQEDAKDVELEPIDFRALSTLQSDLTAVGESMPLQDLVPKKDFGTTSYRLSLIALIGRAGDVADGNPVKGLVDLPIDMEIAESGEVVKIGRWGVEEMTAGFLHRKGVGK
ncbi:hypothetical protein DSOUD_0469 [Desulfuromonas soudanensis]|uniref:Uncharacterized protein n=1 Tax=Desulfuromonas soudanensis TaxID=1603606 RepID=A0A0M5IN10_9BACT|nr:hypothetical protein [Desulfuromonas soudanensis]ALC15261.1 hypothetical protein DSOUD_0469 [Desulfuromonas soudanensis]